MPACSDLAACLEGALTQLTQCPSAGQQFPLDLSSSGAVTNALESRAVLDSFPRVFGSVLGERAWLWGGKASSQGLGSGGNAGIPSPPCPRSCWQCAGRSLALYRVRPGYFISREIKNSWLSQRPGSVLLALESRMLTSRSWMNFCPPRVFSWWELRLAGGKGPARAGQDAGAAGCDAALGSLQ